LYCVGYFMGREVYVDWKIDRRIVLKQILDKWSENILNVFIWCKIGSDHGLFWKSDIPLGSATVECVFTNQEKPCILELVFI